MKRILSALVAAIVAGCAITPQYYYANRERMTPFEVCKAWAKAEDQNFRYDLQQHAATLGMDKSDCAALVDKEEDAAAVGILAVLAVVAIAAIAASGGSGGGNSNSSVEDSDWDWDEFYDDSGRLVWACRGVQTGEFADQYRCSNRIKVDQKWPSKTAPRR